MMASSYYQNLIKRVLEASTTDNWEIAVREWDIVDCEEDEEHASECVCGKENLRYLFTIRNRETGRSLYPIGSSCIEKFERDDLDYEVDVQMDMYRLAHAMERGERIELTSKYFSKKLLYALYEEGAFAPNKYNRYDGTNDYLAKEQKMWIFCSFCVMIGKERHCDGAREEKRRSYDAEVGE